MSRLNKMYRIFLCVLVVVVADQATKYLAIYLLEGKGVYTYLGDSLRFLLAENRGGFLSLGATLKEPLRSIIFVSVTSVFLLLFLVYTIMDRSLSKIALTSSAFIIGGGVGNLIDRTIRDGAVIDFVNIGIGNLRTGIFNVADMAVLFGCIVLIADMWMGGRKSST